MNQFTLAVN